MYCTNCGKENPDSNKFCLQCGQPLAAAEGGAPRPASPPAEPPPQAQPGRSSNRLPLILGGVLLLAALAAAAYFLLPRLTGGGGGGSEMLLAAPNRSGEVDLSVLRLGDDPREDGVVIAENVSSADTDFSLGTRGAAPDDVVHFYSGEYGSFLSGSDRLATFFIEDEEIRLLEYVAGDEAPTEIFSGASGGAYGLYLPDSGRLFITDSSGSPMRCYLAAPGEEAERVARGDWCYLTLDGARIVNRETNGDGEMTLTVTDLDGSNEATLLDEVLTLDTRVSADASHVAYIDHDDEGETVFLRNAAGEELFESDRFAAINSFGFAGATDTLYFVADNGEGEWELYTPAGGDPLVTSPALSVQAARDGTNLAVLAADEDGAGEVSILDLGSGAMTEIASGDNLGMAISADPDRLLVKEEIDGDLTLIAAEMAGGNPVTLFDESDYFLSNLRVLRGDDRVFLTLSNADGEISLYVAPLDGSPGFFVIDEWYEARLLNLSGDLLLLTGREDERDDPILYAVTLQPDANLIELDDTADTYGYAVIAPDGETALYNAITGSNPDDIVVRQVRLDGEEPPEDLYEEMYLAAARWAELDPFPYSSLFMRDAGEVAQVTPSIDDIEQGTTGIDTNQATELHPLTIGSSASGAITQNTTYSLGRESGYGVVYYFNGRAGNVVRIDVFGATSLDSTLDPYVFLLDGDLVVLARDEVGGVAGTNSLLVHTLPQDGEYYVIVRAFGNGYGVGDSMNYQVWLNYD
jgi:hypothetical protein